MIYLNRLANAPYLNYVNNILHAEFVSIKDIVDTLGTPIYLYSLSALQDFYESYRNFVINKKLLICYGMKANSNLSILKEFVRLGAGFDIVSGGELNKLLKIGADPKKIVFSGVGKLDWEIKAALKIGIKSFNIESEDELILLSKIAYENDLCAPISLRVNPDVQVDTHPYISTGSKENKFGISIDRALEVYILAKKQSNINIIGVNFHLGSQLNHMNPYIKSIDKIAKLINLLNYNGIYIKHLDIGGGIGIKYYREKIIYPNYLIKCIINRLNSHKLNNIQIILEPGRSLIGNSGCLITKVKYLKYSKSKNFAIVDSAMNDLLRPSFYKSWHNIIPINIKNNNLKKYDIVGPICESGDWLGKNRELNIKNNDFLAIESSGAYSNVMSSNYNSRCRVSEVIIDCDRYYLIKNREKFIDQIKYEI